MGRPVLRLATRWNRRTRWTAWAIAFACMVLVASVSLVDGLTAGVDSVTARFASGPAVYVKGTDLLTSSIAPATVDAVPGNFSALRVHAGRITMGGTVLDVVVASLEIHRGGNVTVPFPVGAPDAVALDVGLVQEIQAASGTGLNTTVELSVFGGDHPGLPVAPPPIGRPSVFPNDWAWIRPDLFVALDPVQGAPVQALLTTSPLDPGVAANLGLSRLATVGAVGFAQGSVREIRASLDALALLLGAVIALLVYAAMALEVRQRTGEVRLLRSLGAPSRTVAAVFEGQALLLALVGALLGSALGIVAAHAIVAFAPLVGLPNLVVLSPPGDGVALAFLASFAAAAVGGLVPSGRAATRRRPSREAGPS